jgi:hypothetical protein
VDYPIVREILLTGLLSLVSYKKKSVVGNISPSPLNKPMVRGSAEGLLD